MVLTQYKSHSLDRHISKTWRLSTLLGNYVARCRRSSGWAALVRRVGGRDPPEHEPHQRRASGYVVVFGADNIYRMDPRQMVASTSNPAPA